VVTRRAPGVAVINPQSFSHTLEAPFSRRLLRAAAVSRSLKMSSIPLRGVRRVALGACLAVSAGAVHAQPASDPLTERVITLRGEVEQLNSDLTLLREEQRSVLAGLNAQRAELSASVDRQQLLAREAQAKLAEAEAQAQAAGASGDTLSPLLLEAIDALAAQVRGGLPFKVDERLGELEGFRTQLQNGTLSPSRGVNRLWAFFEDEFRLTRENSLHSQTLQLGNERVLAEVAKLGSMALYFRTQDGRLGQAQRTGAEWRFVEATEKADTQRIAALFDALGKQIRSGYFELPLAAGGSR
jgi:hypothetical protein